MYVYSTHVRIYNEGKHIYEYTHNTYIYTCECMYIHIQSFLPWIM
jgi:hypothetical protein